MLLINKEATRIVQVEFFPIFISTLTSHLENTYSKTPVLVIEQNNVAI